VARDLPSAARLQLASTGSAANIGPLVRPVRLRALGCDEIQGLRVTPPMKARECEEWLERGGVRHLARQFDSMIARQLDFEDGPVDVVMKWASGSA
jgi:hypothetical protein